MSVIINGKTYRNLQEQVEKNSEDIDALKESLPGLEVGTEFLMTYLEGSDYISVDLNEAETKVAVELDETMLDDTPIKDSDNLVKSGGIYDALSKKVSANRFSLISAGALTLPSTMPASTELVGVGTERSQLRIKLGDNLTLRDNTLSANSGTRLYQHDIEAVDDESIRMAFRIISTVSTQYTSLADAHEGVIISMSVLGDETYSNNYLYVFDNNELDLLELDFDDATTRTILKNPIFTDTVTPL